MNCAYCGTRISDEEWLRRYKELREQGIMPKVINLCNFCRKEIK